MKKILLVATAVAITSPLAFAADYAVDTKGAHASINFKVQHLGYSWMAGRFNDFDGKFSWDSKAPTQSKIELTIDTSSVDSNHAERDKHLRSDDFLGASEFPKAKFVSTKIEDLGDNKLKVHGDFTLRGVTQPIVIDAYKLGEGKDPWGGYRVGFGGTTSFKMADYGVKKNLGPASQDVVLELHVEGIRQ